MKLLPFIQGRLLYAFVILLTIFSSNTINAQCSAGWCYTQNGSMPSLTVTPDVANNPQDSPCLNPDDNGGATENCHEFVFDASSLLADPCPPPEITFIPWQGCGNGVGNIELFADDCTCISGSAAGIAWTLPVDPVTYIGTYIVCTTSNKMNTKGMEFCRDFCWEPPAIENTEMYGCPPAEGGAPAAPPAIQAAFLPGSGGDDEIATEALGAIIYDFHCSVVETEAVDTDNGGSGCYGDPYIVTRTYTIFSDGVSQGSFTETYTWEDPLGLCPSCIPETCEEAAAVPATLCQILAADPGNPLETLDCDGGGIDNLIECNNAGDPDDPADDCSIAISAGIDICALIAADPANPLATADCDGGGVDNATECANGGDPADDKDECTAAIAAGVDICALIAADPTITLATLDCDMGGIDNATECGLGMNPGAPADDLIALPVDLISFVAKNNVNEIQLDWITASEVNNDKFIIERSADGITYTRLAEIKGAGNSTEFVSYQFIDKNPLCGNSYYKLVQIDFNGKSNIINPISAQFTCGIKNSTKVFPNPFVENLNIEISTGSKQDVNIEVFDITGNILISKNLSQVSGSFTFTENMSNFGTFMFFVKITYADGSIEMHKVFQAD